jgi:hypothetical protein
MSCFSCLLLKLFRLLLRVKYCRSVFSPLIIGECQQQNARNHNLACFFFFFARVWNLFTHIQKITQVQYVLEFGSKEYTRIWV